MAKGLQLKHEGADSPVFAKRQRLIGYSQAQLDAIAEQINNRPRKGLVIRSSLAVLTELLRNRQQHSTRIH
jgi:IS30 family transposase